MDIFNCWVCSLGMSDTSLVELRLVSCFSTEKVLEVLEDKADGDS